MDLKIQTIKVGDYRTNCYLVIDKNNNSFLVDPGAEAELILDEIKKSKSKLNFILLTHGHFDHVLAVDKIKEVHPKIDVFMSERDVFLLEDLFEQGVFVNKFLHKFKSKIVAIKEGDELNHGDEIIKIIETPGHTPGGACYLFGDNLFTGDTLFYHTFGRVDLPMSSAHYIKHSLNKLFELDSSTKVWPGHGRETTIGEEKSYSKNYLAQIA